MIRYKIYLLALSCVFLSCASSYHRINPMRIAYPEIISSPGVEMEYKYDVLRQAGNKKYARKADDKNIQLVAIKFTNLTNEEIDFGNDVDILAGDELVTLLEPEVVKKEVKQVSGLYMLWSLLWLTITKCEDDDCSVTPIPVGLLIGIGNMAGASGANKNFGLELEYHNMLNKIIKPGETVKGILAIRTQTQQPLEIRLK